MYCLRLRFFWKFYFTPWYLLFDYYSSLERWWNSTLSPHFLYPFRHRKVLYSLYFYIMVLLSCFEFECRCSYHYGRWYIIYTRYLECGVYDCLRLHDCGLYDHSIPLYRLSGYTSLVLWVGEFILSIRSFRVAVSIALIIFPPVWLFSNHLFFLPLPFLFLVNIIWESDCILIRVC